MKRVIGYLLVLLLLTSCQFTQSGQIERIEAEREEQERLSCADPIISASFYYFKSAKSFLASYYKTRTEKELFFAWYASEDAVNIARTVRKCYDKRNKHFHAYKNIFTQSKVLQRLIVQNMRQSEQAQLSELYLDEYNTIFVRDIQ